MGSLLLPGGYKVPARVRNQVTYDSRLDINGFHASGDENLRDRKGLCSIIQLYPFQTKIWLLALNHSHCHG